MKASGRGWSSRVFTADPELGFAPAAGSSGAEFLPFTIEIPVFFDADGFRVPSPIREPSPDRPSLLALGCSWTYGAASRAEDTYPEQAARRLGLTCRNAGVPSYGLSQMLLLARKYIPRLKPAIVVAQYSDWLVDRSRSWTADTEYGFVPTPFFVSGPEGVGLRRPVFTGLAFDLPTSRYRGSSPGILDYVSFLAHVGGPLIVKCRWW